MFNVIIPARFASERLPGKPLREIVGKPMIQHVYERACESRAATVVVATDDERVARAVEAFGGKVCLTAPSHPSGTDRLQEAARLLGLGDNEIVVNVQGDEPLIPSAVIEQVAHNLVSSGAEMASLFERIDEPSDVHDPNIVKVVTDDHDFALYFSRAPIPFDRSGKTSTEAVAYKRHLGIYAYRVSFLNDFVGWEPSQLETTEKLEQLRALSRGVRIHVAESQAKIPPGVDTEEDLMRTIAAMQAE